MTPDQTREMFETLESLESTSSHSAADSLSVKLELPYVSALTDLGLKAIAILSKELDSELPNESLTSVSLQILAQVHSAMSQSNPLVVGRIPEHH